VRCWRTVAEPLAAASARFVQLPSTTPFSFARARAALVRSESRPLIAQCIYPGLGRTVWFGGERTERGLLGCRSGDLPELFDPTQECYHRNTKVRVRKSLRSMARCIKDKQIADLEKHTRRKRSCQIRRALQALPFRPTQPSATGV